MALSGNTGGSASAGAIKAGEAFFEITGRDAEIRKLLAVNVERFKAFARTIQNIGIGSAGVGAAIFTPLAAVFKSSLDRAGNMEKLSQRLGTSTETLSAFGYAAEASGVQTEDWVKAAEKMQQAALQAAKGGTDQAAALELIGTNAQDFSNMKLEDKFLLVAKAVEQVNNPLEKQMLLSGLFGDEFGKLLPLFSKGREGIKGLMAEAGKVGAVINSDDARAAVEINKDLDRVWASAKNTVFELGLSVLNLGGNIKDGSSYILQYLQMFRDFIKSNREAVATVALIAAGLIAGGIALATFGLALQGIIGAVTGFVSIAGKLLGLIGPLGKILLFIATSPFTILRVAILGVIRGFVLLTTIIPTLIGLGGSLIGVLFSPLALKLLISAALIYALYEALKNLNVGLNDTKSEFLSAWETIKSTFFDAWEGIVGALQKGDLALAGEIAMAGLKVAWLSGLDFLTKQWVKFKNVVVDGFMKISDIVADSIFGWQVIIKYFTEGAEAADKFGREVGPQLAAVQKQDQDDRKAFREQQITDAKKELEAAKERFKGLAEKGKAPKPEAPKNPIEEEENRRRAAMSLGDSVKGTFTSADFKGALGLGKANEAAKKQYEIAKQQLGVLIDINKKIEPGVFQ